MSTRLCIDGVITKGVIPMCNNGQQMPASACSKMEDAEWPVQYGGLLALKYVLAVRQDLLISVLAIEDARNAITNG